MVMRDPLSAPQLVLTDTGRPFRCGRQGPRIVLPDICRLPLGGWFGRGICGRGLLLQGLEEGEAREAVDPKALGALIGFDCLERRRADDAVRLASQQPVRDEKPLEFRALFERKMRLVSRPWVHEGTAAAEPVGEMPYGEGVGFRHVVMQDRAEIVEHEEGRAARAFRGKQARFVGGTW